MAQDITLLGASYEDVPAVELPKTGGGTASFTDITDATVTASDVMGGVSFYAADGTKGTGTLANTTLGQGYGTCSTAESTTTKVVTLSGYNLAEGGIIAVKFTNAVPASAKLNVNSKGAKNIKHTGSNITAGQIGAGDTAFFMYDGSYYHLMGVDRAIITGTELGSLESALGL